MGFIALGETVNVEEYFDTSRNLEETVKCNLPDLWCMSSC